MKIVYLHGFGSQGNSAKSEQLRERFGSKHVVAPNLPIRPRQVKQLIDQIVSTLSYYNAVCLVHVDCILTPLIDILLKYERSPSLLCHLGLSVLLVK